MFQFQQGFFAFDAPAVASHVSAFSDHAVTGNGNGDWVGGAGSGHGPGGGWLSDGFCHLAVGTGGTKGDGLQLRPHPALKGRRLNVERERCAELVATHLAKEIIFPGLHGGIVATANRKWELMAKAVLELVVRICELDGADAFFSGCNQHASKR